ncbi:preprotein translocase subunit SecG [candidate division WOR-3 bacterium]|nr:preprotein translocase subunit SecG [candidate division WOR-3 bacterium]
MGVLIGLHVFIALVLILVILMQPSRAGGLGAIGGGTTYFGPRGYVPFLTKITVGAAAIFFVTSLSLALMISRARTKSAIEKAIEKGPTPTEERVPTER